MPQTIGYIGAGIMATGMAKVLLENGYKMAVWNRSSPRLQEVSSLGAKTFTDFKTFVDFVRSENETDTQNIFLMCVSDPAAVKSIFNDQNLPEILNLESDHLVDMSTVDIETVNFESSQMAKNGNKNFLEAPVSGSKPQANSGTLVILTSGNKETFNLVEPLFEFLGKKTFYYGKKIGAAARMKLCVNQFMGNVMASLSESLLLAKNSEGISETDLIDVLLQGALNSPIVKAKAPNMVAKKFDPNFPLEHQEKDLKLAVELGAACGVSLPVTEKSLEQFSKVRSRRETSGESGQIDMCGVYLAYDGLEKSS